MQDRKLYHRRSIRLLRRCQAGQALVELALTLPLMLVFVAGSVALGSATYAAIEVANAAKAAVQYAAMNGGANTTITTGAQPVLDETGMQTAANNDVFVIPGMITGSCGQAICFTTTPTAACSCSNGVGTSTCYQSDCPSGHIIETITVKTQVSFQSPFHLAVFSSLVTFHGQAIEEVLE